MTMKVSLIEIALDQSNQADATSSRSTREINFLGDILILDFANVDCGCVTRGGSLRGVNFRNVTVPSQSSGSSYREFCLGKHELYSNLRCSRQSGQRNFHNEFIDRPSQLLIILDIFRYLPFCIFTSVAHEV